MVDGILRLTRSDLEGPANIGNPEYVTVAELIRHRRRCRRKADRDQVHRRSRRRPVSQLQQRPDRVVGLEGAILTPRRHRVDLPLGRRASTVVSGSRPLDRFRPVKELQELQRAASQRRLLTVSSTFPGGPLSTPSWILAIAAGSIVAAASALFYPAATEILLLASGAALLLRSAIRRYQAPTKESTRYPLLADVYLLPLATALSAISMLAAVVGLTGLVAYGFTRHSNGQFTGLWPITLLLLASLPIWVLHPSGSSIIGLGVSLIAFNLTRLRGNERQAVVISVIDGIGLYLLANVVALAAGAHPLTSRLGTALATGGPFQNRQSFALTWSEAVPPAIARILSRRCDADAGPNRATPAVHVRLLASFAALYILLAANYRTPIVVAVVLAMLLLLRPRLVCEFAPAVGTVVLLLPFLYPLIRGATDHLVEHVASAVPYMDRVETRNEAGLSDRDLVWSNASAYSWTVPLYERLPASGPLASRRLEPRLPMHPFFGGDGLIRQRRLPTILGFSNSMMLELPVWPP